MNISIHLHGTPRGYVLYPADGNEEVFRRYLLEKSCTGTGFVVERRGALVHYTIVYHGLETVDGENHASLALSLTLNSVLCKKPQTLFRIMDDRLKSVLLHRGKLIVTIEKDRVSFLASQFYEYQSDIEMLEKSLQQDLKNKLDSSDWLSLRDNIQGETLDTLPISVDWSMGEEYIVDKSLDTPFFALQSSDLVDALYSSSYLLRKRRRFRRIVVTLTLVVGLLIGGIIAWQIKPTGEINLPKIQTHSGNWSSVQATDINAPHWAIIEPLKGKKASYNVYFLRYIDSDRWVCEKYLSNFSFASKQEHKMDKIDIERELITGCNNVYSDITQKRIRVVVRESEFEDLDKDYKKRLEALFGKIIQVPEDWIRDNTTNPWQIAYPIENRKLI